MKGKKKMKKKTKEILEILKGFMINSELKNHTAEIVLYKKSDSHFTIASYISNILVQKLMLKKLMNLILVYG